MLHSPLRYPGGKSRAVEVLAEYIPVGTREILSPFFGGGSFELYCLDNLKATIYGHDIYKPLVCFWKSVVEDNDALVDAVSRYLPLVDKEHYYMLQDMLKLSLQRPRLEIAKYFFVLNRCSFSGNVNGGFTSYKINTTGQNPRFNKAAVERLRALKDIPKLFVSCCSFEKTLRNYPDEVFTYLDPPYLIKDKIYSHQSIDYLLLNQLLKTRHGPWLLSYNDTPEVRELYQDFHIVTSAKWNYGMNKSKHSNELLILSHELSEEL